MKRIVAVLLLLALALGTLGALAEAPKAASVAINSKNFPDKTLLNYVKKNFDKNRDGKLSAKERNAVKKITLFTESYYNKGKEPPTCKTMKGIEHFPNLEALYCDFCGVEKLDVSKNTNLVTLCCICNELKKLNVSKNKKLEKLACYGNFGLTKLDVTKNTRLKELLCDTCGISALDVTKCPNLKKLYCGNSPLKKLDVTRNPKLEELYCGGGQEGVTPIAKLDVTKNPNLKMLNCSGTRITKLNVSKNPKLKYLFCEGLKKLTVLDVSKNTGLVALYAGDTGIKKLDIKNNKKLQESLNGKADINGWVDEDEGTIYWGANVEVTGDEKGVVINRTTKLTAGSKTLYNGNK